MWVLIRERDRESRTGPRAAHRRPLLHGTVRCSTLHGVSSIYMTRGRVLAEWLKLHIRRNSDPGSTRVTKCDSMFWEVKWYTEDTLYSFVVLEQLDRKSFGYQATTARKESWSGWRTHSKGSQLPFTPPYKHLTYGKGERDKNIESFLLVSFFWGLRLKGNKEKLLLVAWRIDERPTQSG